MLKEFIVAVAEGVGSAVGTAAGVVVGAVSGVVVGGVVGYKMGEQYAGDAARERLHMTKELESDIIDLEATVVKDAAIAEPAPKPRTRKTKAQAQPQTA